MHKLVTFVLLAACIGCAPDPGSAADAGDGPADDAGATAIDAGATTTDGGNAPPPDDGGVDPVITPDAGFAATGACTNSADTAIHDSTDVSDAVGTCAGDCFGGASCTTDCVVTATGLSQSCAECYGDVTGCTSLNCAFQCLGGGDSPSCSECRDTSGCTAAFDACSGR